MELAGGGRPPRRNSTPRAVAAATPNPIRIMVCDDEPNVVRLIRVNLERHGHIVIAASDGVECLDRIALEVPDLLILDIMLPRLDGFEILHSLRSAAATENLPVLVLSARARDQDIVDGYRHGADMYLTKPFNPRDLLWLVGGYG